MSTPRRYVPGKAGDDAVRPVQCGCYVPCVQRSDVQIPVIPLLDSHGGPRSLRDVGDCAFLVRGVNCLLTSRRRPPSTTCSPAVCEPGCGGSSMTRCATDCGCRPDEIDARPRRLSTRRPCPLPTRCPRSSRGWGGGKRTNGRKRQIAAMSRVRRPLSGRRCRWWREYRVDRVVENRRFLLQRRGIGGHRAI